MAESKSNDLTANSLPVKEARAKEEIEAISHSFPKLPCHRSRGTHGLNNCIDENTSLDDVRAPNVFERAKEEFQALAHVFHQKKESTTHDTKEGNQMAESKHQLEIPSSPSEKKTNPSENILARAKKEIKAIIHHDDKQEHIHHKETHGMSDDIDENTPASKVKGPSVFERVKEEFEAVFQAIHPKKES